MLQTIHTELRQDANGTGGIAGLVNDTFTFKCENVTKAWPVIKNLIKDIAPNYGFGYESNERGKSATETFGSLLALLDCYRPRFTEMRMGTGKITTEKSNDVINRMKINLFGLKDEHVFV